MLTFEMIRKFAHEEKTSSKLVELPKDFFKEVKDYLERKSQVERSKEDLWELESARMVLNDLLEMREKKILIAAFYYVKSGVKPENLIGAEKEFFKKVVESIKELREKRKEEMSDEKKNLTTVAFLESLPAFVGTDMKTYGPFNKGDIATLPEDVAELLLKKGVVRVVNG
ncbi:MAG: hypothetical protein DRP15_02310 [Candidatus Aenigmatarchaeota archaeon]|nr:MAG: hypothetical protein DRP15_02310 [Candidatus Aenigmarchaeota archaeon]